MQHPVNRHYNIVKGLYWGLFKIFEYSDVKQMLFFGIRKVVFVVILSTGQLIFTGSYRSGSLCILKVEEIQFH